MSEWDWEIVDMNESADRLTEIEAEGWVIGAICPTGEMDRFYKVFKRKTNQR